MPVGEDIGFLPGHRGERWGPWGCPHSDDNLEVLGARRWIGGAKLGPCRHPGPGAQAGSRSRSLNFMRGRTFLNKFVRIDEAQNLTPKQMKTLITRAGSSLEPRSSAWQPGADRGPYLTEGSSGLTYAVDCFKGWPHSGHVMLACGERSRLADFASEGRRRAGRCRVHPTRAARTTQVAGPAALKICGAFSASGHRKRPWH